ncbi:hypothetical protein KCP78_23030 [Salmonella enterica subsp. enterica]|nr:hypothetical protein KCP78_23030 [Salmonella enterica subsp. enterica]
MVQSIRRSEILAEKSVAGLGACHQGGVAAGAERCCDRRSGRLHYSALERSPEVIVSGRDGEVALRWAQ